MAETKEVPETNKKKAADFSFVVSVFADPGEDVILPVHLSPETSAVSMNISWYRGTELIYQYKNEQESINGEYKNQVSLSNQELERGNLSLTLRNVQQSDSENYTCYVIHDGCLKTVMVHLQVREERKIQRQIMEEQRKIKELKLEGQINELELEKQIMKLKMERQIMKMERRIEDLVKQIQELPLPTHALHGPTPRRRDSIDWNPPLMSDDGRLETPKTDEENETMDTKERGSGDQNTTQTGEESTVSKLETPDSTSQVQQSTSNSEISSTTATQSQENPGETTQDTGE